MPGPAIWRTEFLLDARRQTHGIGLRAIEALPADKIDATVIPNMRTPKQLVVHMYASVFRELAEGTLRGKVQEIDEKPLCDGIKTQAELLQFATAQWQAAEHVTCSTAPSWRSTSRFSR